MKISPVKAFSRAKHKTTSQKVAVTDLVVATPIKSPNEDDETPNDAEKKVAGKTPDLDNKTPSDKGEEEDAPSLEESEPKIESIKVVYTIQKSSTGKPSFTKQYKVSMDNNELEVQGVTFLDTDYTRNGRNNYEVFTFCVIEKPPGESDEDAYERVGKELAAHFESVTTPFNNVGNVVCKWGWTKKPKALSDAIGVGPSCKILVQMYHPYLVNATFWDESDVVLPIYFPDEDVDVIANRIKFEHKQFKEMIE